MRADIRENVRAERRRRLRSDNVTRCHPGCRACRLRNYGYSVELNGGLWRKKPTVIVRKVSNSKPGAAPTAAGTRAPAGSPSNSSQSTPRQHTRPALNISALKSEGQECSRSNSCCDGSGLVPCYASASVATPAASTVASSGQSGGKFLYTTKNHNATVFTRHGSCLT